MNQSLLLAASVVGLSFVQSATAQDALPFDYSVETFQHETDDIKAFVVRLEQPFLADEFEKSNYLRLRSADDRSFLIYPRETRFEQKHAEFYGRLRENGKAVVKLSYETVSENPDGSRKINSQTADIEIEVPDKPIGVERVYKTWAQQQNDHFADLLRYYPGESFFEYVLLQSRDRYGVTPPNLSSLRPDSNRSEEGLYSTLSGGLKLQKSLQRNVLRSGSKQGDLVHHISTISAPKIDSLDYARLLKQQAEDAGSAKPAPHSVSALIPQDQYLLHFNSSQAANGMHDSFQQWAEPLYRMLAEDAQDHHLLRKYERQLGVTLKSIGQLYDKQLATEFAITGSDFFVAEGTDVTLLLKTKKPTDIAKILKSDAASDAPDSDAPDSDAPDSDAPDSDVTERSFNYRGVSIHARYTTDRRVSAFTVQHEDWLIISNSHVGIRRIVDTIQNQIPALKTADDYLYMTTLLPAESKPTSGYFYVSDALLRHLNSPEFKIGERRRKQSFNHLVMLNNASLFHRLEYGRSPNSIAALIEGRFVTAGKITGPQGGAYSIDTQSDTATSSVFNRIKYLTPIRELRIQKASDQERSEYDRYVKRYDSFWRNYFAPIAIRFNTQKSVKLDYCVLPFASRSNWKQWQSYAGTPTRPMNLRPTAKSAFASVRTLPGRKTISDALRTLPGVSGVLQDDPTLTDLAWLGDGMSLNFCDAHTLLEIDPTQLKPLKFPFPMGISSQAGIAAGLFAAAAPVYVSFDVEDGRKAQRFLDLLSSRVFLHQQNVGEINTAIDAYRLPAYKDHEVFVVSYRVYVARVRLYLSVVGDQLVAATEPGVLREVIDVAEKKADRKPVDAQLSLELNAEAMLKLTEDVRVYWQERSRRASHNNIMPITTLLQLYNVSIDEVDRLSDSKYGVTYFCPDGEYKVEEATGRVYSTAYGNRREARQTVRDQKNSTFSRFLKAAHRVFVTMRLDNTSMQGTLEISLSEED